MPNKLLKNNKKRSAGSRYNGLQSRRTYFYQERQIRATQSNMINKMNLQQLLRYGIKSLTILGVMLAASSHAVAKNALRITANHLPPYMIISEDPEHERYSGFEFDLTMAIAKELGTDVEFVECTWKGCIDSLKKGQIDLVHALLRSPEREAFVDFLEPPYLRGNFSTVFYQRFDDDREINEFEDMVQQEMVVGYLGSTVYFPEFANTEDLIKVDVKNIEIGLKLLTSRRIDALAGFNELFVDFDKPQWIKAIKQSNYQPSTQMQSYSAISKKSEYIQSKAALEKALQSLQNQGKIEALRRRWIIGR
ncbi:MAG: transporter substrate-binding domain-containing protein [Alteromonadaceae bacterium]|nr:transporter substrate-binding domain-containing protein [Alteromonadaceae bacterium]